ncbi:VOC family protein [Enhygromyxa salina]|uniref:Glyoxalase-like domain protein n=1 Tax=Enhygromyxa salina TaxID=215803 RepID=A0A2S9YTY9_9BACT|nr:VOC family protein [Enhygromyxa salina]PRQ08540.1 Glyoxalase-like domain protein [Enhygromyxa salina]
MRITNSALSLNVADPRASAAFLIKHFGFAVAMEADGFVSLAREDAGFNLIFLRVGLPSFKPASHAAAVSGGLLIAFVVDAIDEEYERLRSAGVPIVTPIETESWGERYFQVRDPNGILVQLVQWFDAPG